MKSFVKIFLNHVSWWTERKSSLPQRRRTNAVSLQAVMDSTHLDNCEVFLFFSFTDATSDRCLPSVHVCVSSSALMESLITPLQDKIEDWKKTANQLDKDHAKGETWNQLNVLIHEALSVGLGRNTHTTLLPC